MLTLRPGNINLQHLQKIVSVLNDDGVIIIPTDTVYALACSLKSRKGYERICAIRNIKPEKANFSLAFPDLSSLSEYTRPFSREVFRLMKTHLPGPFTFILNASSKVPDLFRSRKKTIGIRVPDNEVLQVILKNLDTPLVVASLRSEDEITGYYNDATEIDNEYADKVDLVVDGGFSEMVASTVIDCTSDEPVVVRDGKGASSL